MVDRVRNKYFSAPYWNKLAGLAEGEEGLSWGLIGKYAVHRARKSALVQTPTQAFHMAWQGHSIDIPLMAISVGMAKEGEKLPTLAGETASWCAYPLFAFGAGVALSLVPGGSLVPAFIRPLAANFLASVPALSFAKHATQGLSYLSKTDRRVSRINMGGNYMDTETAAEQRRRAVQEMNGSRIHSRQWLGNEARYFHG